MPVIGTLTVNLEANTASFSGDLGKAASGLRDFGDSAKEAGEATDYSMTEARHGVMMLGEEFGVHLPRGLTSFIAGLGPVGAAMEAAFPFLAIATGATILIEHLSKLHEADEKLVLTQQNFGTVSENVLNGLNDKLLEAGIKADELAGNHLAALQKRLELIDHATLKDLVSSFDTLAKAADASLAEMTAHWYQMGSGSKGALHTLTEFKANYDSLLAQGKDKEANDLLAGTLDSAKKIVALQETARSTNAGGDEAKQVQWYAARAKLQQESIGWTDKELDSRKEITAALSAQVTATEKIAALKRAQDDDAAASTGRAIGEDQDKAARMQAQQAKQAADAVQEAWEESYKAAVSKLQESEKEKIAATLSGSKERLAVIDAAIKEEQAKGLEDTAFYKSLLTERIKTAQEEAQAESKLRQSLADEALKNTMSTAEQIFKTQEEAAKHALAMGKETYQQEAAQLIEATQKKTADEIAGYNARLAALDKFGADYLKKRQELNDKIANTEKQGQLAVTKIQDDAEKQQFQDMQKALDRTEQAFAQTAVKAITSSKSIGQAFAKLGQEMIQHALTNLLEMESIEERKKMRQAASSARSAYTWVMEEVPFPVNAVLAPVAAAAAFAGVMAFEYGGEIPGSGPVPIIAHGGETVVTKALTDQVKNNAEGRPAVHIHMGDVQALDAAGVSRVLEKHADLIGRHVTSQLRKQNNA